MRLEIYGPVIFDLDGTLIDSVPAYYRAMGIDSQNRWFAAGAQVGGSGVYDRQFCGLGQDYP